MKKVLSIALVFLFACCAALADERMDLRRDAVVRAVEKAAPAVVNISTEKVVQRGFFFGEDSPFNDPFFDQFMRQFGRPEVANSLGSGGIFTPDGFIFTNAHVVDRASKIMVTLSDGAQHQADLVNVDLTNDLAVIKISADKPLPSLVLGRSDDLMVGERSIAVGNPLGLSNSVTEGVISALRRDVSVRDKVAFKDVLQTDTLINPGNSGGPLLNVFGEVIGVNSAIIANAQGIGFAIPVDRVKRSLAALLDYRKLRRMSLGLDLEEKYLDSGPSTELRVRSLEKDGPAARAGIAAGDVIMAVNGQGITTLVNFMAAILATPDGPIRLTGVRGSRDVLASVTPLVIPKPDAVALARKMMGLSVQQMDRSLARHVGINIDQGILVSGVDKGSAAETAELAPGDVVLQVNDTLTADLESFAFALEAAQPDDKLYLVILRRQGMAVYQYAAEVALRH